MNHGVLGTLLMAWCIGMCASQSSVVGDPTGRIVVTSNSDCEGGVVLADGDASCSLQLSEPITASIDLRAGRCSLGRDVHCESRVELLSAGKMQGNGHVFHTPYRVDAWSLPRKTWHNSIAEQTVPQLQRAQSVSCGKDWGATTVAGARTRVETFFFSQKSGASYECAEAVSRVCMHPNDEVVLLFSRTLGSGSLWYATQSSGSELVRAGSLSGTLEAFSWSECGGYFACVMVQAGQRTAYIYQWHNGQMQLFASHTIAGSTPVTSCALSKEGSFLAIGREYAVGAAQLMLFATTSLGVMLLAKSALLASVSSVAFDRSDQEVRLLVSLSGNAYEGAIRLYEKKNAGFERIHDLIDRQDCRACLWNTEKNACITGEVLPSGSYQVTVWNRLHGELVKGASIERDQIPHAVSWSSDGQWCLVQDAQAAQCYRICNGMQFSSVGIIGHAPILLKGSITCDQTVLFDGNGGQWMCDESARITCAPGSQVTFRDITFAGTHSLYIAGDQSASVTFERCTFKTAVSSTIPLAMNDEVWVGSEIQAPLTTGDVHMHFEPGGAVDGMLTTQGDTVITAAAGTLDFSTTDVVSGGGTCVIKVTTVTGASHLPDSVVIQEAPEGNPSQSSPSRQTPRMFALPVHEQSVRIDSDAYALATDMFISEASPLTITQDTVIDGQKNTLWCQATEKPIVTIAPGAVVTFRNTVLHGLSPSAITGAGTIKFEDGVHITFGRSGAVQQPWIFNGLVSVDGKGAEVVLRDNGGWSISQGGHLVCEDCSIKGVTTDRFQLLGPHSRCTLKNKLSIHLESEWSLNAGSLLFAGKVCICGPHRFRYSSPKQSTLQLGATLTVTDGCIWTVGHSGVPAQSLVANSKSTLIFDDAGISAEGGPFALEGCKLCCKNNVVFDGSQNAISLGSNDQPIIFAPQRGAIVHAYGIVTCAAVQRGDITTKEKGDL